jgi:hypothetical protein
MPLDEWSAYSRYLYLTTHLPLAGLNHPAVPETQRPKAYALARPPAQWPDRLQMLSSARFISLLCEMQVVSRSKAYVGACPIDEVMTVQSASLQSKAREDMFRPCLQRVWAIEVTELYFHSSDYRHNFPPGCNIAYPGKNSPRVQRNLLDTTSEQAKGKRNWVIFGTICSEWRKNLYLIFFHPQSPNNRLLQLEWAGRSPALHRIIIHVGDCGIKSVWNFSTCL